MATNVATNITNVLRGYNIRSVTEWTDCTVFLFWLEDQESYKVFVENKVNKGLSREFNKRNIVPTKQTPTEIGSWDREIRPSSIIKLTDLWCKV